MPTSDRSLHMAAASSWWQLSLTPATLNYRSKLLYLRVGFIAHPLLEFRWIKPFQVASKVQLYVTLFVPSTLGRVIEARRKTPKHWMPTNCAVRCSATEPSSDRMWQVADANWLGRCCKIQMGAAQNGTRHFPPEKNYHTIDEFVFSRKEISNWASFAVAGDSCHRNRSFRFSNLAWRSRKWVASMVVKDVGKEKDFEFEWLGSENHVQRRICLQFVRQWNASRDEDNDDVGMEWKSASLSMLFMPQFAFPSPNMNIQWEVTVVLVKLNLV